MPHTTPGPGARALALASAATATTLALTGCGLFPGSDEGDDPGAQESPPQEAAAGDPRAEPGETNFPYVREGLIAHSEGEGTERRFAVTGLERTDEYIVMYYERTYLNEVNVADSSLPPLLIDPVTGRTVYPFVDEDGIPYGSVGPRGDGLFPAMVGVINKQRVYFPRFDDEVSQVTLVGTGHGAMTGLPIVDVEEERPTPENPNGADPNPDVEEGDTLEFEVRRPDNGVVEIAGGLESFVDAGDTSTTRDSDTETVALSTDVMFEFDSAELTAQAEEVVRQAAAALIRNIDPEKTEVSVVGHTDGQGADDYNQTLSEERAESVRAVLEAEVGDGYTFSVEGRGASEPVAQEGGADDEEARARNRRVEFSYSFDEAVDNRPPERDESLLPGSSRNVYPPADFQEDPTAETVATATDGDVRLDVHSLVRDGAYVVGTVSLTNIGERPVSPDLDGDVPGAPDNFTEGSLGGFQLVEPDSDVARYVSLIDLGEFEGEEMVGGFTEDIEQMHPGNAYQLIAVFPAPPVGTDQVTLRAGAFGDIPDVPIS